MDLGLTGRVAIVATASKGLRRAVAEELAREGARVSIMLALAVWTPMLPIQVVLRLTCLGTPAGSVARCRRAASDVHRLFWPGKLFHACKRASGDI